MSFLVVGHTKFLRTSVGSLKTITEVVDCSAQCTSFQLVVEDDSRMVVPTYDWTDFFATRFRKIPGIKKSHHYRMTSAEPG